MSNQNNLKLGDHNAICSSCNQAKPDWANDKFMELWYKLAKVEERRTGKKVHVDHIIPLKGRNVCGLHCEDNMQLLFAEDNWSKGNSHV